MKWQNYFLIEDLKQTKIHSRIANGFGDSTPISADKEWTASLSGSASVQDDSREGSRKSTITPEIVEKAKDIFYYIEVRGYV